VGTGVTLSTVCVVGVGLTGVGLAVTRGVAVTAVSVVAVGVVGVELARARG